MRKLLASTMAATVFFTGATASAELGEEGSFALSADRLFGLTSFNVAAKPDGPNTEKTEYTGTSFSLLWGPQTQVGTGGVEAPIPASVPRASFDYFVIESLSLGGSLGYYSSGGKTKTGPLSADWGDVSGFAFAPRVGYVFGITDSIWFWLRGGPLYMSVKYDPPEGRSTSLSIYQLEVDGVFAFGLGENFAFHFGPSLALPLGGKTEIPVGNLTYDVDVKVRSFGIYGGLVGWL